MSAAEVRRAMRLLPVVMATSTLAGIARIAIAAIQEQIAAWLAVAMIVGLAAWLVVATLRVRRRYRARLNDLRDPITGSWQAAEALAPLPVRVRLWLIGTPVLVAVAVVLSVGLPGAGNTCVSKGIATAAAREGICKRGANLFGGGITFNVVDAGHVLQMSGFDAQLLATSAVVTPVSNASISPNYYPNGTGMLVCLKIALTNDGATPLAYDASGGEVSLLLQDPSNPNTSDYFTDEPNLNQEPRPSLATVGPIQPGQTETGWVAFVAPQWAMRTLNARATDLQFKLPDNSTTYLGQIRLWKAANAQGTRVLVNHPVL
jgi:hypothetical protein